ncbi:hypothetical protein [Paludibacterium purpuratum]|uniref:Uncharacterized protein n=1 Tax=Paludibacterium purpuratum TaxID=1144873 RepID=A0A4V3DUI4_9NEIS|nr:hypothetical protein [Paludibacterium purpuratum]TDR73080.1 hypothetical protein DFP86_115112 [Paludibacterium purpuratum]
MSAVKDAITAIREALRLSDDVKRVGDSLKSVAEELRQHDRRITRLEAKWETAMELAGIRTAYPTRQLEDKS